MAYIDAKYLFKCETCRSMRSGKCTSFCDSGECYSPNMSKIPTADVVEVKHGTWLKTAAYPHRIYCSLCCKTYVTNEDVIQGKKDWQHPTYCTEAEYCPHCGARMDGWRC